MPPIFHKSNGGVDAFVFLTSLLTPKTILLTPSLNVKMFVSFVFFLINLKIKIGYLKVKISYAAMLGSKKDAIGT